MAEAARVGLLDSDEAGAALQVFYSEWNDLIRVQPAETAVTDTSGLTWEHELLGYDSGHLATALFLARGDQRFDRPGHV